MSQPDWKPTWRKPVGILLLMAFLTLYAILAVSLIEPISRWHVLLQVPVYLVLGIVWLLPLKRFLIWMETGRWSAPE
ncbi:DUF2842 domain-containing protein [Croceicoccus naphthovorans]|uniref:Uncharacterized protein n=1 Tax=Croceicoccus naphthovorans TaxID=1348774 RepID=A0A0G3XH14_9SPHN|nr:DUF2842 domain-containing protein [Croceicoccus naphthovorans]AKM09909.1 hypothetical protein AB433_07825 [Croceicoccus naphthovorans]MBB3990949.1 uncharacterized protein (DUF983 family) [Croceicoccus naphthovorans]